MSVHKPWSHLHVEPSSQSLARKYSRNRGGRSYLVAVTGSTSGADPGFSYGGGGGAQKIMCPHTHYERGTELTFGRGPGPA